MSEGYRVSARSLCEFTAKRGDLDRRFTPSATALEGLDGQAQVAARRGADCERELALEGHVGCLHVRGRADGCGARAGAARMARIFGADAGYADWVPAMQKVVQAAGRVLRTPQDRGWLWLLDERYAQPAVARLLPPAWGLATAARPGERSA